MEGPGNEEIDAFVASFDGTMIYTTRDYIRLVTDETGSQARWITLRDGQGLRAVLPLALKHGELGTVVNSLPYYGSNGSVVCNPADNEAKRAVVDSYTSFCRDVNAAASTLITNPLLGDVAFYEAALEHDLTDRRIGQITTFPSDPETLMAQFEDPRPRNIRKAQRSGITVEVEQGEDAIAFLFATHDQNIRAIGGLPKSRKFFESIPAILPENSWNIYVARIGGERIAALLLLYFNGTVEYFTPSVVEEHRSSQALSLLIYQAMVDAMSKGFKRWNWGGTWLTQDGVYAFKKKWGTTDFDYRYFTSVYSPAILDASRETLLEAYPGFFVVPFGALTSATKGV